MAVPSTMADLSVTASSNSPAGTESPSNADDFMRSIQAILRTTNAKGNDIASASTTDIGAATAEFVDVTGTTTITSLGTISAGIVRTVRFTGALTLTHNVTSLQLPGSANITTAAGDVAIFRSLGSGNWKCVSYVSQNGNPITLGDETVTPAKLSDDAFIAILGDSRNLIITNNTSTPNSQIDIDADEVILKDSNGRAFLAESVNLTVDIATAGANGLDTGSEASGTWYYGWVIAKEDGTVAGLLSASSSSPTMPTDYTYKALVTAVRNDGSSNFIKYRQYGAEIFYVSAQTVSSVLNSTTEASFSTSTQVPTEATAVYCDLDPTISANGTGEYDATFNLGFVSGSYVLTDRYRATGHDANLAALLPSRSVRLPNVSNTLYYDWNVTTGSTQSATLLVTGFKLKGAA